MLGNVWEWTADFDPHTADVILRGGAWKLDAMYVRASYPGGFVLSDRSNFIGFRCAGELR
jgi:formylglycine-generating enzyme required for sulfatase activity